MAIEIPRDRVAEVLKAVRDLIKKEVLIGVPAEGAERQPDPGEANPPNNAVIGYRMEFGDPEDNLPPRPHLLPAVEEIRDKAIERLKKAGEQALSGKPEEVEKSLHAVGLIGQNAVRARITSGPFTPLSPVTIKRRKAKGRTGEKPLIDTGQYRRAHTYVVVPKGKR